MKNTGITLIALVITIIILLILAGVSIATLTRDNGILNKANMAKEETIKAEQLEELKLKVLSVQIEKQGKATLKDVVNKFQEDLENQYSVSLTPITEANSDEIPDVTGAKEIYVIYKNYQFKIDEDLNIIVINKHDKDMNQDNSPVSPLSKSRYLLIEVNDYFENGDGAVLNEIAVYNKNYEKIEFNVLNELVFDNVVKGKPFYWEEASYWNYTNLNDNEYAYTSNAVGNQNCTSFLFNNNTTTSEKWARFVIDLGEETEIGQIRIAVGGYDEVSPTHSRTPKQISIYSINNFKNGLEENSTYSNNVIKRNDEGLTFISQKTLSENILQAKWINFLENNLKNSITARHLLFEVKDYFENGDGAVLNEIALYDIYGEKINYTVLKDLEYDSTTKGKSMYWEDASYWNYTNLNDNEHAYTSNAVGNQNCTLLLCNFNTTTSESEPWARFIIDLGQEVEISQIKVTVGGYDEVCPIYSRTPKEISLYSINNFKDGLEENSTYTNNIVKRSNDDLNFIAKKTFDTLLQSANEFNLVN